MSNNENSKKDSCLTDTNLFPTEDAGLLGLEDKIKVKILDIDNEKNKISLSIKEAVQRPKEDLEKFNDNESAGTSLADLLKDFKF